MSKIIQPGAPVIFMKVGVHAKESLEDIIKRKQDEYAQAGKIFWGYGGNTCHPTSLVQPFAKAFAEKGLTVNLVMNEMHSKHNEEPELAKEYSDDGVSWYPVPDGIGVRGSRYALVIGGLTEDEFDLNLRNTLVAVGPSRGRYGSDYIQHRVDKGCFEITNDAADIEGDDNKNIKQIDLYAPLTPPYAVFLK